MPNYKRTSLMCPEGKVKQPSKEDLHWEIKQKQK
jgi:hypothetical protein